ncbi:MAG: hypothetical protein IPL08_10485 [Saprospiraceae bacterium]|nr:hypothetical protein [Saprospiraceae bacterium]
MNSCAGGSTATFTQTGGPAGGTWTVSGGGTIGATTGVFNRRQQAVLQLLIQHQQEIVVTLKVLLFSLRPRQLLW